MSVATRLVLTDACKVTFGRCLKNSHFYNENHENTAQNLIIMLNA